MLTSISYVVWDLLVTELDLANMVHSLQGGSYGKESNSIERTQTDCERRRSTKRGYPA